jgi:branched-chain amino acid transport system ATP-binding protein
MLKIRGLNVSLSQTPILRDASLAMAARGVTGLLGRNGAGKTTLLRAAMGLVVAQSGSIRLGDAELATAPAHRRAELGIGYLPEDRRLVPHLSVEENILAAAWAMRIANPSRRISEIYERIPEIAPLSSRPAASLSGGQQKLVALGRALLVGTRLLLLDEPTEGVAPALADRILAILHGLDADGPPTLIAESNGVALQYLTPTIYQIERGVVTTLSLLAA